MLEQVPTYISLVFGLTTVATLTLFVWTVNNAAAESTRKKSTTLAVALTAWLVIQALITFNGMYNTHTEALPPNLLVFGFLPTIATMVIVFTTEKGRQFVDSLPLKNLTYLHTVRIPVEIVLFWLFLHRAIPELMTFEGRNADILAGITAPVVAYAGLTKEKFSRRVILIWNIICLGLLFNIVVNAVLAAPFPFQKFAFDQPNRAVLYFPFSWLPTFVVPAVLFSHVVAIRQLTRRSAQ